MVSWKKRISIVVLTALAALPVTATLCAMQCETSASSTTAHHGSTGCEEQGPAGAAMRAGSGHGCSHREAAPPQTATAPTRTDGLAMPDALPIAAPLDGFSVASGFDVPLNRHAPANIPASAIPLVLRV